MVGFKDFPMAVNSPEEYALAVRNASSVDKSRSRMYAACGYFWALRDAGLIANEDLGCALLLVVAAFRERSGIRHFPCPGVADLGV